MRYSFSLRSTTVSLAGIPLACYQYSRGAVLHPQCLGLASVLLRLKGIQFSRLSFSFFFLTPIEGDPLMSSLRTLTILLPRGAPLQGRPGWSLCLPYLYCCSQTSLARPGGDEGQAKEGESLTTHITVKTLQFTISASSYVTNTASRLLAYLF